MDYSPKIVWGQLANRLENNSVRFLSHNLHRNKFQMKNLNVNMKL